MPKKDALTDFERAFAEDWIQHREAKRAAIAAGGSAKSAHVTGSRLLKKPRVMTYIAQLTQAALEQAQARREGAIADLSECLEFLTTVKRAKLCDYLGPAGEPDITKLQAAPAGLIHRIKIRSTTDEKGQVFAEHDIHLESALAASKELIAYHVGQARAGDDRVALEVWAQALTRLSSLPPRALGGLLRAWLAGKPIDVEAKRLPNTA